MKLAQLSSCFVALTLAGAIAVGCGKKETEPQAVPTPSGTPAAVPADPAPASDAGAAATDAAAPTPVTPTPATPRPSGGNIDGCCAAIAAIKTSGRTSIDKGKAAGAAAACTGIAKRVKDGATSRADGLTQVKSLLQGVSVPECN
jgi:hypothetical protein